MTNLTYGHLLADEAVVLPGSGTPYSIDPAGTDLISTLSDGTVVAYNPGDISWTLTSTALVFLMVPGLGFLYSGLVRRKSALHQLLMSGMAMSITSIEWWFWGYSLAFSDNGGPFMGDLKHICFRQVGAQPIAQANYLQPAILYASYQAMFACVVAALAMGATAERGRLLPGAIFIFVWGTLVYAPVARWVWHPKGWAFELGVLDYAGGGPIEIVSGVTGLTYSLFLGKRRGYGAKTVVYRPHNISHIWLGTILLWAGWIGFNGGSTFAANIKAAMALWNTNLAACFGALTWMLMDFRLERKFSAVGFCTGAICGMVAITPAAGYVGGPASAFIGVMAGSISNVLTFFKSWFGFDDAMDIYACHGVAGIVGLVFTGVFAQNDITANDAFSDIAGGWIDHNWVQMGYQFAWCCACWGYTFVMTYAIMFLIDKIPGCHFRADEEQEIVGLDEGDLGEFAYDFVMIRRHAHDLEVDHPVSETESVRSEKNAEPISRVEGVQHDTLAIKSSSAMNSAA